MTINKKYFKLYANCLLVKGFKRSLIYDLQKGILRIIPNKLYEVLLENRVLSIDELKSVYNNSIDEGIDRYISLLIKENYGFLTNDNSSFTDLNLQWDYPSIISNAIIDLNSLSNFDLKGVILQLNDLGCSLFKLELSVL